MLRQQGYLIGTTARLDRVLIQREVNSRAGMSAQRALDYNRHSRGPELILSGSDSTNPFRGSKITYSKDHGLEPKRQVDVTAKANRAKPITALCL